jgi:16S rRNA processing protein RimM
MASRSETAEFVTLARVVKTQGRRGELAVELLTDIPGRLAALPRIWLSARDGRRAEFSLTRTWPHKQWLVLELEGIADLNAAEPWVGAQVQVPARERAQAPVGSYFISDLLGSQVYDGERLLGELEEIEPVAGAADLLHVRTATDAELLIPFAAAYVESIEPGAMRLRLPEGLVELNP